MFGIFKTAENPPSPLKTIFPAPEYVFYLQSVGAQLVHVGNHVLAHLDPSGQFANCEIEIEELTLVITSLNSRVIPAFMMRGFLQIAFAILSSTRRPIASW